MAMGLLVVGGGMFFGCKRREKPGRFNACRQLPGKRPSGCHS